MVRHIVVVSCGEHDNKTLHCIIVYIVSASLKPLVMAEKECTTDIYVHISIIT